jgi:putative transcriptional regulator
MGRIQQKLHIENTVHVFRAEKRMSQQELADAVDVTRATINALESGGYNPSLELAFRIAKFFNAEIQKLFFLKEEKNEKRR